MKGIILKFCTKENRICKQTNILSVLFKQLLGNDEGNDEQRATIFLVGTASGWRALCLGALMKSASLLK